jgi:hypothetical protein
MQLFVKKNHIKIIGATILTMLLLLSHFSVIAQISETIKNDSTTSEISLLTQTENPTRPLEGFEIMLEEDFTDGHIPPIDPLLGQWTHTNYSNNETWDIDESHPYSEPNCSTVHRGNYKGIQDECLITPALDFSNYQEIKLRFRWYTSQLIAQHKDLIDLNVSISVDNGQNWTLIWNEDTHPLFVSWTWQDSNEIDLTSYAGENNVLINFQYYSSNNTDGYLQEYSIDDIFIYGNSTKFWCDIGGPYEISWSWNLLNGVKFHGDVGEGQPPYLNWTWNFGDGQTSKVPYVPVWTYDDDGIYNISLVVTDSAQPKHIAFDNSTVKVIETPPPDLKITIQGPSIGIIAEVENTGMLNVSHIDWSIDIEWGPLKAFKNQIANGTLAFIEAKTTQNIESPLYFLAFGIIRIIVTVEPLNTYRSEVQKEALKFGPLVFWIH